MSVALQDPEPVPDDIVLLIAQWPDGTWCELGELNEMGHMNDDFEVRRVLSQDCGGNPVETEKWKGKRKS